MAASQKNRVGLWMIGACGGVGSTVALGLAALAKKNASSIGLVSELPPFANLGLAAPGSIVVGGHEIRRESLLDSVRGLSQRSNVLSTELIQAAAPTLRSMQREIKPGTLVGAGSAIRKLAADAKLPTDRTPADAIARLAADINSFQKRHKLDHVVVVHLASSEPTADLGLIAKSSSALQRAINANGRSKLPTSCIYALAAVEAGCGYINFTPSVGIRAPSIRALAASRGICYMGSDGKTGETLVKSVLAPMFAMRNLRVLSWTGQNILGNRDGLVLRDPKTRASKIASKDGIIGKIVGGSPDTLVSIDYVPSLDDWKIAWDFIHFEGFLGTKMSMQFIWQGCDSLLAAPLVIDLARFTEHEMRAGRSGVMRHLSFFFKDPLDATGHDLSSQWRALCESIARNSEPRAQVTGRRHVT